MKPLQVKTAMLADLKRSGLDAADAKLMRLSCEPHKLKPATPGYVIPYFDINGRPTKFFRVRYVESTLTGFAALSGKKPQRYGQAPNTINEVYLPPHIDWKEYLGGRLPIIITEGEKKAAAATKAGYPTIGLGGVWCFMSKRAEASLLPIFEQMNLKDRQVYICFDSDAATNPDIVMAEEVLARRLTGQGASVLIARIPAKRGGKVGMDDYILAYSGAKFRRNVLGTAFPHEANKELHLLNTELVYVRNPGIIYDHTHEMRLSATALTQHSHSNRFVNTYQYTKEGGTKLVPKPAAKMWLEWEHRAEVFGITYAPGQARVTPAGELNTWTGWGVADAVKGDIKPWNDLLNALFDAEHAAERQWFERWCAFPIQNPGYKMASAVVMWGVEQGTGKTLIGHILMKLYGQNATEVKDSDLEDDRFAWAENKQFVLADDITGQSNRKLANKFKTMVTQKTMHINPKYVPSYTVPDCINYYFTSNDPDAFYLDDKDRRFFIHEVLAGSMPEALRKRVVAWRDSTEGIQALFYHLLNLDLGNFDPQAPAMHTDAKHEMTLISKSELGSWVARLKEEPGSVLGNKLKGDLFTAEELYMAYDPLGDKRASPNALARELKRAGFRRAHRPVPVGGRRLKLYIIRNPADWVTAGVKEIAAHYEKHHGTAKF